MDALELAYSSLKSHAHNLVKVGGQAATENTAGYKDYYECKDSEDACHQYFEDRLGKTPIENIETWKLEGGNGYIAPKGAQPEIHWGFFARVLYSLHSIHDTIVYMIRVAIYDIFHI